MRRITYWVMTTLTVLMLLFGYHTSTEVVAAGHTTSQTSSSAATKAAASTQTSSGSGSAGSGGTTGSSSTSSGTSTGTKTYTGSSVDTRYGPVQVKITVTNGKVTSAEAIDYPMNNGRDQEINSQAIPQLNSEASSTATANIDMVSGATYTSNGYIQSLQSALDQAKIA